jgi:transposase-like protein
MPIEGLKGDETLAAETELRQNKYLNHVIEQDHRNIKRIVKLMMRFKSFNTARRTLRGIESMNMIGVNPGNSVGQAKFVAELFGVVA